MSVRYHRHGNRLINSEPVSNILYDLGLIYLHKVLSARRTRMAEQDFEVFESKIDEVVRILELMNSSDKDKQDNGIDLANK